MRRWRRGFGWLMLVGAVAGSCGRRAISPHDDVDVTCNEALAREQLDPGDDVRFIADTAQTQPAWRAAVGAPVVDRAGRSCEAAPLDSILVVSWNIHLGHADLPRFVADLRNGRAIPGAPVRHFVILIQEAYRRSEAVPPLETARGCTRRIGGARTDIEEVADSLGLALFYVPSMRNGCERNAQEDRGNAILATLPLTNLGAVELPLVRQRRVVALAEVKGRSSSGDDWTLALASVHLENRGSGGPRSWVNGRARQAEALVRALPDSVLLAVGGDFNTIAGPDEPAIRIVDAEFANSPAHQRNVTFVSYAVVRSHLDYLFFRCFGHHRSTYWRARERYGSDHYPIMGFVRVR